MFLSRIAFLASVAAAIGVASASRITQENESVEASPPSIESLDEIRELVKASVEANIDALRQDFGFVGGDQSAAMAAMAAATSLASKYSAFDEVSLELDATGFPSDGRSLKGATIQSFAPQDSLYNRKCGEVLDIIADSADLTNVVSTMVATTDVIFSQPGLVGSTYDDYFGPAEKATGRSKFSFLAKNGIKAVKICAKCSDYRRMVMPRYRDAYGKICDGYGGDGTVSALALIPIDENGDIPEGAFEGNIWYRGVQAFTYDAPSGKWPSAGLLGITSADRFYQDTDFLGPMIIAGSGKVVVLPDGIGFGESASCFKGVFIKDLYNTATVPVYLATKRYIEKSTNCKSELSNTLSVSGYSEGGYAAVVVADALTSLGFHIKRLDAGAMVHNVLSFAESGTELFLLDRYRLQFSWTLPIIMSTVSSTVPGVANFGDPKQGLTDPESRMRIIQFVAASLFITDLRALSIFTFGLTGTGAGTVKSNLNPEVISTIENGKSFCENEKLDKLCLTFKQQRVTQMVKNAPYPVSLCHSPFDDLILYDDQYPDGKPLPNSHFFVTDLGTLAPPADGNPANNFYGHGAMKAVCSLAYAFDDIDAETPNLKMSGQCKRRAKKGN